MKVGDLVRVKNVNWNGEIGSVEGEIVPGFMMCILECDEDPQHSHRKLGHPRYYVVIMEGMYKGVGHWIHGESLEVISES